MIGIRAVLTVVSDSATPWTVARQAPLSMRLSSQVERAATSFSRGSSRPGIRPESPASPALAARSLPLAQPGKPKLLTVQAALVAQSVKRLPAMRETRVWPLGQEDPLEKEMAMHSGTLAWKIPRTEEPGRLQLAGSQGVRPDWATALTHS